MRRGGRHWREWRFRSNKTSGLTRVQNDVARTGTGGDRWSAAVVVLYDSCNTYAVAVEVGRRPGVASELSGYRRFQIRFVRFIIIGRRFEYVSSTRVTDCCPPSSYVGSRHGRVYSRPAQRACTYHNGLSGSAARTCVSALRSAYSISSSGVFVPPPVFYSK